MQSVCIFGDSLAKGVVLDEKRNRYQLLKQSFVHLMEQRCYWKAANYAKFGITVKKGEQILQNTPDDLSQYDYTVLEFGGNDCNFNWAEVAENPLAPHTCQTPLEEFQRTYEWMIEQVRARGGKPVALSLPPIDAQRYFAVSYTHLLLAALLDQDGGLIPQLLVKMGVEKDGLLQAVQRKIAGMPRMSGAAREADKVYISQDVDRALVEAEAQAERMQDAYISVEHVMLGLLEKPDATLKEPVSYTHLSARVKDSLLNPLFIQRAQQDDQPAKQLVAQRKQGVGKTRIVSYGAIKPFEHHGQ